MTYRIGIQGIKGGQGTSTLSVMLGLALDNEGFTVSLRGDGINDPSENVFVSRYDPHDIVVGDDSAWSYLWISDLSLRVVRPCYLAMRAWVGNGLGDVTDILVTYDDPDRALDLAEVQDITGIDERERIIVLPWHKTLARSIDAGLMGKRGDIITRGYRAALEPIVRRVVADFAKDIEEARTRDELSSNDRQATTRP